MAKLNWTNRRSSPTNTIVAFAVTADDLQYKIIREDARQFQARVFRIGNTVPIASNGFNRIDDAKAWCQNHEDTRASYQAKAQKAAPERMKRGAYRRCANVG